MENRFNLKKENATTFNTLLSEYYNKNQTEALLYFLYNHCIFCLEIE